MAFLTQSGVRRLWGHINAKFNDLTAAINKKLPLTGGTLSGDLKLADGTNQRKINIYRNIEDSQYDFQQSVNYEGKAIFSLYKDGETLNIIRIGSANTEFIKPLAFNGGATGNIAAQTRANLGIPDIAVTPQMYGAVGDGVVDDTTAIQTAYDENNFVYIPEGTYLISSPIGIWKNNSRIYCEGELKVNNCSAIHITGNSNDVYVRKISTVTDYTGNGIQIGSDSASPYYNNIEIGTTGKLNNGIWFTPNGTTGIAYTTVRFKEIIAKKCIYFNPGTISGSFINENTFYGGVLSGENPIYTEQGGATDPFNGNKFNGVAFEGCSEGMVLKYFQNNHFNSCRFSKWENSWETFVTFDENSYGNYLNFIGFVFANQIIQSNHTGQVYNIFDGRLRYTTDESDGIEIGRFGIMIGDNMIIKENDRYDSYTDLSDSTDFSSQKYAIEGYTYNIATSGSEITITVPNGYWYGSAMHFYVNVTSSVDTVNIVIRHSQGWLATLTESGLYKIECNAAKGWTPHKVDEYAITDAQINEICGVIIENSEDVSL